VPSSSVADRSAWRFFDGSDWVAELTRASGLFDGQPIMGASGARRASTACATFVSTTTSSLPSTSGNQGVRPGARAGVERALTNIVASLRPTKSGGALPFPAYRGPFMSSNVAFPLPTRTSSMYMIRRDTSLVPDRSHGHL
jgi:hypothetical protein